MLRAILSGLCLFALVGFTSAAAKDDDKGFIVTGKYETYRNGVLTVIVGVKDDDKGNGSGSPSRLKVDPDFKVWLLSGDEPKEVPAKEAFDKLELNTKVVITFDADRKLTKIEVGKKKDN